jgi:glycosyltransferase involved in cell wall biosynthesis
MDLERVRPGTGLGFRRELGVAEDELLVATPTGGIPAILEDGVHGLLFPARDPPALAGATLRFLNDPELVCRLAEAGLLRVRERFNVDAMVEGNLAVYREFER